VPVLLLQDGQVIDESLDIMLWALNQNTELSDQLYPSHLQADIKNLISENDGPFKWALDRYKYSDRFEESEEFYLDKAGVFLTVLNSRLQHHHYLFADSLTLGDLAVFPFVRQLAHVNKDWFYQSDYTRLIKWLDALLESDVFKSIMTKYTKWLPENETVYFPS
jgi:glutathione S-transferase